MPAPILVTSAPRTGSSSLTGVLNACSAWVGHAAPDDEHNPKGYFENEDLIIHLCEVMKNISIPDPLHDLLNQVSLTPKIEIQKKKVAFKKSLRQEFGYQGGAWVLKSPALLDYVSQLQAFFNSASFNGSIKWVITRRSLEDVVTSGVRVIRRLIEEENPAIHQPDSVAYDAYRLGLTDEQIASVVREYTEKTFLYLEYLKETAFGNHYREIWPIDELMTDPDLTAFKELVDWCGLEWNEGAVRDFVDRDLVHHHASFG